MTGRGARLEPDGAYDGVEFLGLDLSGQAAPNASFVECGLLDCRLDGVDGCRFGALEAYDTIMVRVSFEGGKLDFVNLRGAKLRDVSFDGCALGEVDVGMAELRGVRFTDCRIDRLELSGAKLDDVDLSHSELQVIDGIGGLAGATMSGAQLMALGEVFGRHLGVHLREPGDTG